MIYNDIYKVSKEYQKPPRESVYFPVWKEALKWIRTPIYELGCGVGQLAQLIPDNMYVGGVDFSQVAIEMATKSNPAKRFVCKNIYNLNTIQADTVLCMEVLEHLHIDRYVIEILKPKTIFIFSVPNFWSKTHVRTFKDLNAIIKRYGIRVMDYKKITFTGTQSIIHLVKSEI